MLETMYIVFIALTVRNYINEYQYYFKVNEVLGRQRSQKDAALVIVMLIFFLAIIVYAILFLSSAPWVGFMFYFLSVDKTQYNLYKTLSDLQSKGRLITK